MATQHQVQEIVQCGKDPAYFIKKYTKIQHPIKGLIPFDLYPFQEDAVNDLKSHRFNVILKSRQLGISTLVAAFSVWLALFHRDKNILIIATKLDVAMNFITKVQVMIQGLPPWLMLCSVSASNKQSISFSHGSKIKAIPTSDSAGRSEALSLLIVDEAAFVPRFDTLWTALYPTLSTGGDAIILSTPNGVGGQYHKIYTDAEAGLNEFNPIKFMWDVHPERDQIWFNKETKNMSKKQVAQELMCDFASSGETFLSVEDIEYIGQTVKEPIARLEKDRNFWIWEHSQPGVQYLVSADIARGDSKDFSAAHILRLDNGEIVAEYKGKIAPDRFGELLNDVGRTYNNALMCPENNSFGFATIIKLRELNYPKMYLQTKKFDLNETAAYDAEMGSVGFNTNSKTRSDALTKFEELIRNKEVKIHSSRFFEELKTFIWSGSRAQAMKGTNDDLIMSLAIALWLYDMSGFINRDADKITAIMIQSMSKITNQAPKDMSGQAGSGTPFLAPKNPYAPYISSDGRAPLSKSGKMVPVSFDWLLKK